MEPILLSVLDENYNRIAVIDIFTEFAWTVRFNEAGDFEFSLPPQSPYVKYLAVDNYLYIRESDRLMVIDKVLTNDSVKDAGMVTVTGSSLESILNRRIVWEKTTVSGNLQQAVKRLINAAFVSPSIEARRVANFTFKESTDEAITNLTIESADYFKQNLYDVISDLCQEKKIGYRILPDWSNGGFIFELYAGTNRSYTQSDVPWVIFSPAMENLLEGRFVETREDIKTAALAVASDGSYGIEVLSDELKFTSLQRREIAIDTNVERKQVDISSFGKAEDRLDLEKYGYYSWDVTDENYAAYREALSQGASVKKSDYGTVTYIIDVDKDEDYWRDLETARNQIQQEYQSAVALENNRANAALTSAAKAELAKYNKIKYFDGDIVNTKQFVFGRDFFVGDVVQVRDSAGHEGVCTVKEVMITQDDDGVSISPTFESN